MIETNIQSDYHRNYFIRPLEQIGYRGKVLAMTTGYSVALYHDDLEWHDAFCNDIYGLEDKLESVRRKNEHR